MEHKVCPWWLGYLLASPVRRLWHNPRTILQPFVTEGMQVLEPGCGMGFFTVELARLVGPRGKVVAVDVQPQMIAGLKHLARKAGLVERIDARLAKGDSMEIADLAGTIDFTLAFAMIHELPNAGHFLDEVYRALKPGRKILVAEPKGHVKEIDFAKLMETAKRTGFRVDEGPAIRSSWTAVFTRD
ncbi:MAG: class I SAM-dependent methyltransferase [Acidobacteriota bacterium]|jgi:ubiquinone/menaquinone biosynthesis C-methylase UbiE